MNGLDYMHAQGISHRDIKPENILLDHEFTLKIADFGFASAQAVNETRRGTESYMAPEINLGKPYHGPVVDLFAAGIILFIMIAQHPPFAKAIPTDPHYKLVCANRLDLFWKFHSRSKEGGDSFFSEEFKDLISTLLMLDPTHRPSVAEITAHPWINGETATEEQIREEFAKRKNMLDGVASPDTAVPESNVSPSIFTDHATHRGERDMSEMDVDEESKVPVFERTAKQYMVGYGKVTQFFSDADPEKLFNTVAAYAQEKTSDFNFDEKSYKCKMSIL